MFSSLWRKANSFWSIITVCKKTKPLISLIGCFFRQNRQASKAARLHLLSELEGCCAQVWRSQKGEIQRSSSDRHSFCFWGKTYFHIEGREGEGESSVVVETCNLDWFNTTNTRMERSFYVNKHPFLLEVTSGSSPPPNFCIWPPAETCCGERSELTNFALLQLNSQIWTKSCVFSKMSKKIACCACWKTTQNHILRGTRENFFVKNFDPRNFWPSPGRTLWGRGGQPGRRRSRFSTLP